MKKILFLITILAAQINFAQNIFPNNGPVGIGTLSPNSSLGLDVNGKAFVRSLFYVNDIMGGNGGDIRIGPNTAGNASTLFFIGGVNPTEIMRINYDGNVGIGTIVPTAKLDVSSNAIAATFKSTTNSVPVTIINTGTTVSTIGFKGSNSLTQYNVRVGADGNDFTAYTANAERMRINSSGNVGIGTANPLAKLEVYNGNILVRNAANVDNESTIMIAHSIKYADRDTFGTSLRTITQSSGTNAYGMQFFTQESYLTGQTEKLRILGNGNVGIGVMSPTNKLDVNGTIHSKEVKVDMSGWSDFVFKKEYKLPSLQQVEKYIAEKGHLENIPNQEEVIKNGINLGEMDAKLLQKIEELTLYSIQQQKEIEVLKSKLSLLDDLSNQLRVLRNEATKTN